MEIFTKETQDAINALYDASERLLNKLKKLDDIKNNKNEKWYKIFAPIWTNTDGKITRYSITYISETALKEVSDYRILETYSNKEAMLNIIDTMCK